MARRWTVRLALCAVAVPLLLAGCSDKHQASQSLPPTKTSAPTSRGLPPVGPADFPVPSTARVKSPTGAAEFARYYIELANHLLSNLDPEPLRDLSKNCETCERLADGYDTNRRAGYHYQGGRLTVTSLGTATISGDQGEIAFLLEQEAVTVLDVNNNAVPGKTNTAYPLSGGISLTWDAAKSCWLVTKLTAERS
jgi:hypothetical protein